MMIESALLQLRREHNCDIGVLGIIQRSAAIPGAEARAYAVHIVKTHGHWLKLVAMVIEDSRVVMQLFASLIRGINFLAGKARLNAFSAANGCGSRSGRATATWPYAS